MRPETKVGFASLIVIGLAGSCGGRSGTELFDISPYLDASVGDDVGSFGGGVVDGSVKKDSSAGGDSSIQDGPLADTTPDVEPDNSVQPDGPADVVSDWKDFFDTIPWPEDGPLGDCTSCIQGQCGDKVNACYNDSVCWEGVQCAAMNCVSGGGGGSGGSGGGQVDYQCMMDCFGGDMGSAMTALDMFQCITQTCSDSCGVGGAAGASGAGNSNLSNGFFADPASGVRTRSFKYIGAVRIPEPEEVVSAYPWLADVLEGRTPNPPPPRTRPKRRLR